MQIDFKLHMQLHGAKQPEIDPGLFRILAAVQKQGTLKNSAISAGLSYRHAWGLIKKWEQEFRAPLLILERGRGRGAKLTELGEKLMWAEQYLHEQLQSKLDLLRAELNDSLAIFIRPGDRPKTRIFASHGMAITYLFELLQDDNRFDIDFQIHGSLDSLRNLNSGHCQIAGFHLPLQLVGEIIAPQYRHWITPNRHLLLKVAVRQQGLLVKKGNPKGITTLPDLTKRSVRFINRQRNSGTRTILDQLLLKEGVNAKNINGYANEEFTHVAVAAIIASGAADAGFGIAAAAEQFNLDFIPYLQEAYVLALDMGLNPMLQAAIRKQLQSAKFRDHINTLAGYNASEAGQEISFQELLGEA
ncbi:MAG: hypothetical protein HW386_825 [Gammaproteobacteria bacterium]|nr:hypothetical protein [Gammaproteobacteria bacterium]